MDSYYVLRGGLRGTAKKLNSDRAMNIAFIGGSVTEGAGASSGDNTSYRALTYCYLECRFPKVKFNFVNAAIGGTDSSYGAFRLKEHVLKEGPIDLLFVEFAVNDSGNRIASLRAMEGIVRHAKRVHPAMDICYLYSPNQAGLNQFLTNGRVQNNIYYHEEVAEHYGIPSVSIAHAIYRSIASGELQWEQFSGDVVHPNDFGYALYARYIQDFLESALQPIDDANATINPNLTAPMDPFCYDNADLLSPHQAEMVLNWQKMNNWTFEHICYWKLPDKILLGEKAGASFQFRFKGTAVGFTILAGVDMGNVDYSIDGGAYRTLQIFDQNCSLFYRPKIVLLADDLISIDHTVDINISKDKDVLSTGLTLRILNFLVNT